MSKNTEQFFDRCRTNRGLNVKNAPDFVGSLSSSMVGIVFDKAQTAYRNEIAFKKTEDDSAVTLTNLASVMSSSTNCTFSMGYEKSDDAFTRTSKIIKRNKNTNDLLVGSSQNLAKRKLEKSSSTIMDDVSQTKKKSKNYVTTFKDAVDIDRSLKKKLKNCKTIKGGYQEPNIDYLFNDDFYLIKGFSNGATEIEQTASPLQDNQRSNCTLIKKPISQDRLIIETTPSVNLKNQEVDMKNKEAILSSELNRQKLEGNGSKISPKKLSDVSSLSAYNYENPEVKLKNFFDLSNNKRTLSSAFTILKKNTVSSLSGSSKNLSFNFNEESNDYEKINKSKKNVGDSTVNELLGCKLVKPKPARPLINKIAQDERGASNLNAILKTANSGRNKSASISNVKSSSKQILSLDNMSLLPLSQNFSNSLSHIKSDLLNGDKLKSILASLEAVNPCREKMLTLKTNDCDTDHDVCDVVEFKKSVVLDEIKDDEKVSQGICDLNVPKLYGSLLSSKVGLILEKVSQGFKPEAVNIPNVSKTSVQMQFCKTQKVSIDTQTSPLKLVSVGTQTTSIEVKKRSMGNQTLRCEFQTSSTQTRIPKTASEGCQTIRLKENESQTQTAESILKKMPFKPLKQQATDIRFKTVEFDKKNLIINDAPNLHLKKLLAYKGNKILKNDLMSNRPVVLPQLSNDDSCSRDDSGKQKIIPKSLTNVVIQPIKSRANEITKTPKPDYKGERPTVGNITAQYQRQQDQYISPLKQRAVKPILAAVPKKSQCNPALKPQEILASKPVLAKDNASQYRQKNSLSWKKKPLKPPLPPLPQCQPDSLSYSGRSSQNIQNLFSPLKTKSQYKQKSFIETKALFNYRQEFLPAVGKLPEYSQKFSSLADLRDQKKPLLSLMAPKFQQEPTSTKPPQYQQELLPINSPQFLQQPTISNINCQVEQSVNNFAPSLQKFESNVNLSKCNHVYSQEESYLTTEPTFPSTTPVIITQEFPEGLYNSTYSANSICTKTEDKNIELALNAAAMKDAAISDRSVEYNQSMIERVLNIIHGR